MQKNGRKQMKRYTVQGPEGSLWNWSALPSQHMDAFINLEACQILLLRSLTQCRLNF